MDKRKFAPIIIGVIVAVYLLLWTFLAFQIEGAWVFKVLFGIPMLALLLLWVYIVKERLDEIRSGEEDDLSK